MSESFGEERVRVAVVTGHHPFDVPGFHGLLRGLAGVDAYVQHMDDFASGGGEVRSRYEAVLFYHMVMETPGEPAGWWEEGRRECLEALGETEQGIVVLHHALLAFPEWPLWSEIVGIADRSFDYHPGQTVGTEIANPDHPITRGLSPWEMVDETYVMANAGENSDVLLRCDHPSSMETLAWTRQHGKARVFCYAGGHDNRAYSAPSFSEVVRRGILWTAGRL